MPYICPWLSPDVGSTDSLCRATEEEGEDSMWGNVLRLVYVRSLSVPWQSFLVALMGGTAAPVAVRDTEVFNQHVITATTLATEKLESLKALGFQRLSSHAYH